MRLLVATVEAPKVAEAKPVAIEVKAT